MSMEYRLMDNGKEILFYNRNAPMSTSPKEWKVAMSPVQYLWTQSQACLIPSAQDPMEHSLILTHSYPAIMARETTGQKGFTPKAARSWKRLQTSYDMKPRELTACKGSSSDIPQVAELDRG